jgi:hypothetical protein
MDGQYRVLGVRFTKLLRCHDVGAAPDFLKALISEGRNIYRQADSHEEARECL